MKNEKKDLYYGRNDDGSYDIVIINYPKQDSNEHVCSWKVLLEYYPKSKYNYIKSW